MKKLFLIIALGVLSFTCSAQVEKLVLTPAKKAETSSGVIIDSIKKVLPEPISNTLAAVTLNRGGHAWNVYLTPASEESDPMFYYVYLKGKTGKQTLVYDKNGNLLRVKQVLRNTDMPDPVKKTLTTKYKDWTLVENEERRIANSEKATSDYKVILKKGILKKAVVFDPSGEIKLALPTV